ncbi:MAG: hypothetical protein ACYCZW_03775 [Minisyncoccota bacterium]
MSNPDMIAYVAVRYWKGKGGIRYAYLPNIEVKLPEGWKWSFNDNGIEWEDVSRIAKDMRLTSVDAVCRVMSQDTGIDW